MTLSAARSVISRSVITHLRRYTKGHFIDKHDDRAMKTVNGNVYDRGMSESLVITNWLLDIALVYYLSRDFTEEDGGAFVDLNEGGNYQVGNNAKNCR